MNIDLTQLRALMEALDEFSLTELTVKQGDDEIVLKRQATAVAAAPAALAAAPIAEAASAAGAATAESAPADDDADYITSPFVGTFYRAGSPTASAFVEAGQSVAAGKTLCIVEAMKLMNEIEAEFACEIVEILVENGKPVEYGDRLFKVRR